LNGTSVVIKHDPALQPGSDRSFGFVMAGAFLVIGGLNYWRGGSLALWIAAVAAVFFVAALALPALLHPLNVVWHKFGLLLHAIVNPIVMGALYFVAVWPTGVVMRALGKDLLRLERKENADTYWIVRQPPGPKPESMKDQF
jgi:hypothetical protein